MSTLILVIINNTMAQKKRKISIYAKSEEGARKSTLLVHGEIEIFDCVESEVIYSKKEGQENTIICKVFKVTIPKYNIY